MEEIRLLDVIREINTREFITREDKFKYEELVSRLYEIKHESGYRTVRNQGGKNDDIFRKEYCSGDIEFIIIYKWKYHQLQSIYNKCRMKYCTEDIEITGRPYRQSLNQSDVFLIILDVITNLKKFNFEEGDKGEAKLVKYLKATISGRCINEFNDVNKVYIHSNSKLYSYDHIVEELVETEDMSNCGCFTYKEMFNSEFDYNKNINIREINDFDNISQEEEKKIYFCWINLFWDNENILCSKNLEIREVDKNKDLMNELKKWDMWATNNQKEKLKKLIQTIKSGEDLFTYSNKGYKLNLKKVGNIIYKERKSNSNKDIYNFIESIKRRFKKYLLKINKDYLLEVI